MFYVKLEDSAMNCAHIVEWNVTIGGTITFTGMGDGVNWDDADNWDLNVIPDYCNDVFIPSPHNPVVSASVNGYARSVTIYTSLTIQNTATLTINGSTAEAIDIKTSASLNNSGVVTIGNTDPIGGHSIQSDGMITNTATGQILIIDAGTYGMNLLSNSDMNNDGLIRIDNVGSYGVSVSATASITNGGDIEIGTQGAALNIGSIGIFSYGTITNSSDGKILVSNGASLNIFFLAGSLLTNSGLIVSESTPGQGLANSGTV